MANNNLNQRNRLDAKSIMMKAPKIQITNYESLNKILQKDKVFINPFGVVEEVNLNFIPVKIAQLFEKI